MDKKTVISGFATVIQFLKDVDADATEVKPEEIKRFYPAELTVHNEVVKIRILLMGKKKARYEVEVNEHVEG